jgi:hypothetical protein
MMRKVSSPSGFQSGNLVLIKDESWRNSRLCFGRYLISEAPQRRWPTIMELRIKPGAYLATNKSFRYITINATKPRRHQISTTTGRPRRSLMLCRQALLGISSALKFL